MTRKQKRFAGIGIIGSVIALSLLLVSVALRDEIVFFYDPTEVVSGAKVSPGQNFRIGGLVEDGSIKRDGSLISFVVTDGDNSVSIFYDEAANDPIPDLFREGQGMIAEGAMNTQGEFIADSVLAKHDENYIPKELEDVLKKKDVWKPKNNGENS